MIAAPLHWAWRRRKAQRDIWWHVSTWVLTLQGAIGLHICALGQHLLRVSRGTLEIFNSPQELLLTLSHFRLAHPLIEPLAAVTSKWSPLHSPKCRGPTLFSPRSSSSTKHCSGLVPHRCEIRVQQAELRYRRTKKNMSFPKAFGKSSSFYVLTRQA